MQFENLPPDFDVRILECQKPEDCIPEFGRKYDEERIKEAHKAIEDLLEIGFSFKDLFKYNDFHEDLDEVNNDVSVWKKEDDGSVEEHFLQAVRRAYFEFYARPEFVEEYKKLVERGY